MTQPQVTAQAKHSCPACGAEAHWNPAKQALICPFCGTEAPGQLEPIATGSPEIIEHDLVKALRGITDNYRGWQAQKTSVKCQSCQAISVFDATRVGQRCDFCGSNALVPYEQIKDSFTPESLLPLKISESAVRTIIRKWYGEVWFAPNKLKHVALTDQVKGVYLPYWTFDAQVHADWQAEAGYYYYTTEQFRDNTGHVRTREVRHVRWQPASGSLQYFFDDELVAASHAIEPHHLRAIEPFPTNNLVLYNSGYLSGWVVERYQIDLVAAAQHSRERMDTQLHRMCSAHVPGDTQRNLQVRADYSGQTFKHILAPAWLLTYSYGPRTYHVVVNGVTGAISGDYPKSWVKIFFTVLFVLVLLSIFFALAER
ncbi:MAG: zinc ribbon domain-containing protein [Deltaproteobacteria bacterium]|nr:zinc ribbon domain-containing protein [Deltaproteobacteria bacterium]